MSFLHSLYAWGVFGVVLIPAAFINLFGNRNWMYLTIFLAFFSLIASYLFCTSPMPEMSVSQSYDNRSAKKRNMGIVLCVGCIFLEGATESVMTNWISGYMGIVVDKVNVSSWANNLSLSLNLHTEKISMKTGMLVVGIFPFIGVFLLLVIKRYFLKQDK